MDRIIVPRPKRSAKIAKLQSTENGVRTLIVGLLYTQFKGNILSL